MVYRCRCLPGVRRFSSRHQLSQYQSNQGERSKATRGPCGPRTDGDRTVCLMVIVASFPLNSRLMMALADTEAQCDRRRGSHFRQHPWMYISRQTTQRALDSDAPFCPDGLLLSFTRLVRHHRLVWAIDHMNSSARTSSNEDVAPPKYASVVVTNPATC